MTTKALAKRMAEYRRWIKEAPDDTLFRINQVEELLDEIARLQANRREAEMRELLAAYAEYVKLLGESERGLLSIASVHGYRTPAAVVRRGEELRQRIAELTAPADLDAPPPQSKIFRRPIEEGEFEE